MHFQLNGATYQSERQISAGGVGRNIAEAIQRLAGNVNFISAVGKDPSSSLIRNSLPGASLYLAESSDQATCNCSVIFDQSGDCKVNPLVYCYNLLNIARTYVNFLANRL